jgi:predicted TIM-barrel fold metal-dependent hydrolase
MTDQQQTTAPTEDIIDPGRPICDPHHHLWDFAGSTYLLQELLADTGSGHNIVSTVYVECMSMYRQGGDAALRPLGETEFVNGVAAMMASGTYGPMRGCAGIVSFADLLLGADVGQVLDQHMQLSSRFRGVRHASAFDTSTAIRVSHSRPPQHMLSRDDFREGFAELGKRDLVFDAWLYHHQIGELVSLAKSFPGTTIILDHFGGPLGIGPYAGRQDELFPAWQADMRALAACDNVYAKLGGILMAINGFLEHERPASSDAIVNATARYYHHTIDCFGPERCMFESNFPVDSRSCSYAVLWNAFKKMAVQYSAREQDQLFHDTATAVYRLTD